MSSKVIEIKEREIVGMKIGVRKRKGQGDLSNEWINYIDILEKTGEIKNLKECFGYCKNYKDEGESESFDYIMAMDKNAYKSIPESFEEEIIPGGKYAVYLYRGLIEPEKMKNFYTNLYSVELLKDGFTPIRYEAIEYYGKNYKHGCEDSEFELWIPIG